MELYFQTREEWHDWLERNHTNSDEVWLICYKKNSGKPVISYNDAVEEALCFGWIDGKVKSVNKDYYIQRYTPRRKGSRWSGYNIDRVEKLIKEDRMKPDGIKAYKVLLEKPHLAYENKAGSEPEIPLDLQDALNHEKKALNNFIKFPPSTRRMYIGWLNSAKKQETRMRRIDKIMRFAIRNIKDGMML